jgi:hypothetical protein
MLYALPMSVIGGAFHTTDIFRLQTRIKTNKCAGSRVQQDYSVLGIE